MKNIFNTIYKIGKKISKNKKIIELNKKKYLPQTSIDFVPVPNSILRSSLFGIIKKGKRRFERNVLKTRSNRYTVRYTGYQLDQSDFDVWLECLHRSQFSPLGFAIKFSVYNFLKSISRNTGKANYKWLKEVFQRLRANDVEISDEKYTYMGSLISEQYRDENKNKNCVILNPKIVCCFVKESWTSIKKNIRVKLKGKQLTQWLYVFYSTHAKPFPMKIVTLKTLCGSKTTNKGFKQKIKKSLFELGNITNWICKIDYTDKVIVIKNSNTKKTDITSLNKSFNIPKGFRGKNMYLHKSSK